MSGPENEVRPSDSRAGSQAGSNGPSGSPPSGPDRAAAPVAGRFVLLSCAESPTPQYVTSWDTWEEAAAAFPIGWMCFLRDDETGRAWYPGAPYEWDVQPSTTEDDDVIAF